MINNNRKGNRRLYRHVVICRAEVGNTLPAQRKKRNAFCIRREGAELGQGRRPRARFVELEGDLLLYGGRTDCGLQVLFTVV